MTQEYPTPNLQGLQMKYHSLPEKHRLYPELLHVPHMRKLALPPVWMHICVCTQTHVHACIHACAHTGVCTDCAQAGTCFHGGSALARAAPLVTGSPGLASHDKSLLLSKPRQIVSAGGREIALQLWEKETPASGLRGLILPKELLYAIRPHEQCVFQATLLLRLICHILPHRNEQWPLDRHLDLRQGGLRLPSWLPRRLSERLLLGYKEWKQWQTVTALPCYTIR